MSVLVRKRAWQQIAVILLGIGGIGADRPSPPFSIPTVFQRESFRPTLPKDSALVKSYGKGVLVRRSGQAYRIYKDVKNELWVSCRIEDTDSLNRPITEIVLSKVNLTNMSSAPGIILPHLQLHGLQFGDTVPDILEKCGQPRRIYDRKLAGKSSFHAYEYFINDKDSCLRFYLQNDRIAAVSISSEE